MFKNQKICQSSSPFQYSSPVIRHYPSGFVAFAELVVLCGECINSGILEWWNSGMEILKVNY